MSPTTAEGMALKVNASPLLAYYRALRLAEAMAVVTVDDLTKGEFQFHFADDSVMIVNQTTKCAVARGEN